MPDLLKQFGFGYTEGSLLTTFLCAIGMLAKKLKCYIKIFSVDDNTPCFMRGYLPCIPND